MRDDQYHSHVRQLNMKLKKSLKTGTTWKRLSWSIVSSHVRKARQHISQNDKLFLSIAQLFLVVAQFHTLVIFLSNLSFTSLNFPHCDAPFFLKKCFSSLSPHFMHKKKLILSRLFAPRLHCKPTVPNHAQSFHPYEILRERR